MRLLLIIPLGLVVAVLLFGVDILAESLSPKRRPAPRSRPRPRAPMAPVTRRRGSGWQYAAVVTSQHRPILGATPEPSGPPTIDIAPTRRGPAPDRRDTDRQPFRPPLEHRPPSEIDEIRRRRSAQPEPLGPEEPPPAATTAELAEALCQVPMTLSEIDHVFRLDRLERNRLLAPLFISGMLGSVHSGNDVLVFKAEYNSPLAHQLQEMTQ